MGDIQGNGTGHGGVLQGIEVNGKGTFAPSDQSPQTVQKNYLRNGNGLGHGVSEQYVGLQGYGSHD